MLCCRFIRMRIRFMQVCATNDDGAVGLMREEVS